jgi:predicted lipoprotein with Yx(FWY)xxD motif
MTRTLAAIAVAAALVFVACGDDDDADAPAPAPEPAESTEEAQEDRPAGPDESKNGGGGEREREKEAKPGTEITVSSSQFGDIVFNAENQAIYLFDKETSSTPECYGACAAAWPPVLTEGEPVASGAAKQGLLGTTERDDGSTQVTYAGQPLYYYAHEGPGEVLCHNVSEFGGLWLVLDAGGQALS